VRADAVFGRAGARFRRGLATQVELEEAADRAEIRELVDPGRASVGAIAFERDVMMEARSMGWLVTAVGPFFFVTHRQKMVAVILVVDSNEDGSCPGSSKGIVVDCAHEGLAGALVAALRQPRSMPAPSS